MDHICTWLCIDEKGEESIFPQTGMSSSSQEHQAIYWRCVLVFFATSRRFNRTQKHALFTNAEEIPVIDGLEIALILEQMEVEVVFTGFRYKTPKGYYGKFQNQFYEFSILEYISQSAENKDDQYLVLDSDCIFIKPADALFQAARPAGFISFDDDVQAAYVINGLSRTDMKTLYEELLNRKIDELPAYHLGEFLLCSAGNIRKIYSDFTELWPELLKRHSEGRSKFNEEAHTLSYLYFRNGFRPAPSNTYMKRIWTNPLFYRNASPSDLELCIWHIPSEKTFGLYRLYNHFFHCLPYYGGQLAHDEFMELVQHALGIPHLPVRRKLAYYTASCYRALKRRFTNISTARS